MQPNRISPLNTSILLTAILAFVFLWLVNLLGLSLPLSVTSKTSNEFSVEGQGKVDVVPDTINISAGIMVQDAKTSDEAEQKISEVNNKIIAAVTALGVNKADIKTSSFSVNPNIVYEPLGGGKSTQNGYTGNATVDIKVTDAKKAPQVIDAATNAGATNVNNNGSTIGDMNKFYREARSKAIDDAKQEAQKLASQLGIKLGRITNVVESGTPGPIMYDTKSLNAAPAVGEARVIPDIQSGTQTVTSNVTLYFEKQ